MGWAENWSNVIRNVLFKDAELKTLMAIPEVDFENIVAFRDKYFVNGPMTDQMIITEKVRILWYEDEPTDTTAENIFKCRLYFDVYVQDDSAYNAGSDRLMHRKELICKRLVKLLNKKRLFNIKFQSRGVFDQSCRAKGYSRKLAIFSYKKIY